MVEIFILRPEATQDLGEAYAFYEGREVGLGEEFLRCVEACMGSIRRHPRAYPVVHENYRRQASSSQPGRRRIRSLAAKFTSTVASPSNREYHRGMDGIDGKFKDSILRGHTALAAPFSEGFEGDPELAVKGRFVTEGRPSVGLGPFPPAKGGHS